MDIPDKFKDSSYDDESDILDKFKDKTEKDMSFIDRLYEKKRNDFDIPDKFKDDDGE